MTGEYEIIRELERMQDTLWDMLQKKNKQVELMTLQTITTIANTIDAREEYTKGHSLRVAQYADDLARRIGWSVVDVQKLHYAALIHDIGNISVPDSILNKPAKLTAVEMSIIKRHTLVGADILKDLNEIDFAVDVAKYHHERYDGTGYPDGLAGEDIPLVARIVAIAEAYDAMSTDRVYRSRLKQSEIVNELKAGRGTQFDPVLTDVFLELMEDGFTPNPRKVEVSDIHQPGQLLARVVSQTVSYNQTGDDKDYLTSVLNRRTLERNIMSYLLNQDGALCIVDLDNFKSVNDKYGHLSGDFVLKVAAEVLNQAHEDAVVGRIGGDEFVIFIKEATEEAQVTPVVESMMRAFEEKKLGEPVLEETSLSIGVALSASEGRDYTTLFMCADKALYSVKTGGKCGFAFYKRVQRQPGGHESEVDLRNILAAVNNEETYEGTFKVGFAEFSKVYNFVHHFATRNSQYIQLLLFTLEENKPHGVDIDDLEIAMQCMEAAISTSLRGVDICSRFSSTQFLVVLLDTPHEQIHIATERIIRNFYARYTKGDVTVNVDVANLKE